MFWYITVPLLAILCVGYVLCLVWRKGNVSFWKLVAKFPDMEFDYVVNKECWLVWDDDDPNSGAPEPKEDYSGPFFHAVPKLGGRTVRVYCKHDEIEASQKRFEDWFAGTSSDIERYVRAAERGAANAQFELGALYHYGRGVPQDFRKAAWYYHKAAGQGHVKAQSNLGILYALGHGVAKDQARAFELFARAAEHDEPYAQNNLTRMYAFGTGCTQDYTKAYMWLLLAIRNLRGAERQNAERNRDKFLAKHMTAEEIERAKSMASEWVAQHPS